MSLLYLNPSSLVFFELEPNENTNKRFSITYSSICSHNDNEIKSYLKQWKVYVVFVPIFYYFDWQLTHWKDRTSTFRWTVAVTNLILSGNLNIVATQYPCNKQSYLTTKNKPHLLDNSTKFTSKMFPIAIVQSSLQIFHMEQKRARMTKALLNLLLKYGWIKNITINLINN